MFHDRTMRAFSWHLMFGLLAVTALSIGAAAKSKDGAVAEDEPCYRLIRLAAVRFRHSEPVHDIRLLADGKTLVVTGNGGTVGLWDAATGMERQQFLNGNGVVLSPDGRMLATRQEDQTLELRDVATRKVLRRLSQRKIAAGHVPAFSPDGKWLAAVELGEPGKNQVVSVSDVASGAEVARLLATGPPDEQPAAFEPAALLFSPDGKVLVATGPPSLSPTPICRWELPSGKLLPALARQPGTMTCAVTFSPDGALLAESVHVDLKEETRDAPGIAKICLWDAATGKKVRDISGFDVNLHGPFFAGNSKRFATLDNAVSVRVWDAATGQEVSAFTMLEGFVTCVALSPDGRTLAVGSSHGRLRLCDAGTGKVVHELQGYQSLVTPHPEPEDGQDVDRSIAFSVDGATVLAAAGSLVRRWRVDSGEEIRLAADAGCWSVAGIRALTVSGDGRTVATLGRDHSARLWDAASGKELRCLTGPANAPLASGGHIAFSADDQFLAVSRPDRSISVWDLRANKECQRLKGKAVAVSFAFLPGSALASGDEQGRIVTWDLTTGKQLHQFSEALYEDEDDDVIRTSPRPAVVAVSPDGTMLATAVMLGEDYGFSQVHIWELLSGKERLWFLIPNEAIDMPRRGDKPAGARGAIAALVFSPDSKRLAAADGGTIHLCDLSTRQRSCFGVPQELLLATALSSPGALLASWSEDGTVRLWETTRGSPSGRRGARATLAFLPDGRRLLSGSTDPAGLIWNVVGFADRRQAPPHEMSAGRLGDLWERLVREDATTAYDALVKMATVPRQTLPWVKERIKPVPLLEKGRLDRLMADLEGDNFHQRTKAAESLAQLGELAETRLRRRLAEQPPLEACRRLEPLLSRLMGPVTEPEARRAFRTVELLEHIGTAEALALLQALAAGAPEARLTQAASAALKRGAKRQE